MTKSVTTVTTDESVSDKESLLAYLREHATPDGIYIRAKHIAADIELSTKQIGVHLGHLSKEQTDLTIEPWATSNATTWRIATPNHDT